MLTKLRRTKRYRNQPMAVVAAEAGGGSGWVAVAGWQWPGGGYGRVVVARVGDGGRNRWWWW
ncbi:hypothetical protein HanIR_Chr11g0546151 [Helianthus annuus]|nr:hypothetical protein HanIR_Chr11g0546151 [Helianthus annuus]